MTIGSQDAPRTPETPCEKAKRVLGEVADRVDPAVTEIARRNEQLSRGHRGLMHAVAEARPQQEQRLRKPEGWIVRAAAVKQPAR
jgi:hypothetical protein